MRRGRYITWSELRVGILVIASALILAIAIFFLGEQQAIFARKYSLVTHMERINGLQVGAPVQLAGVRVGNVKDIRFPETIAEARIIVTLEIDKGIQERIRRDSVARIGTLGLLGDKYLSISQGSPKEPVIPDGGRLKGATPADVEEIISDATDAVDDLTGLVVNARNITARIDRGEGTLGGLIADRTLLRNLERLTEETSHLIRKMDRGEGTVAGLVNDPALYHRLVGLAASADSLTETIRRGPGTVGRLMNDPELYKRLTSVTERMDALLERLEAGKGTAGRLVADERLYDRLLSLSENLDALVTDIRKHPSRYISIRLF